MLLLGRYCSANSEPSSFADILITPKPEVLQSRMFDGGGSFRPARTLARTHRGPFTFVPISMLALPFNRSEQGFQGGSPAFSRDR